MNVMIKGNAPKSGAAIFDNQTALSAFIKELQELERVLQSNE